MRAKRRTRAEWEAIIAELLASGLTTERFAERHGLNPGTTGYWRAKLGRELGQQTEADQEVGFVEVVTDGAASTCVLRLQHGGVTLDFSALPPSEWLAAFLARC